jgi:hypothetical protein
MLQAMANPSIMRKEGEILTYLLFCLELEQELDDKTEEIKKLAYETSTRLKSINQQKIILIFLLII